MSFFPRVKKNILVILSFAQPLGQIGQKLGFLSPEIGDFFMHDFGQIFASRAFKF